MSTEFNPRLYVGTYAKYNAGSIRGEWLTLSDYDDAEAFYVACAELHEEEEDPEFMFQDCEDVPADLYSESGNVEAIYEFMDFVNDSHLSIDAIRAGLDIGLELEDLEDNYEGEFSSDEDFAQELADSLGAIPDDYSWPNSYIDWERAARDLMMDYGSSDGHYFRTSF